MAAAPSEAWHATQNHSASGTALSPTHAVCAVSSHRPPRPSQSRSVASSSALPHTKHGAGSNEANASAPASTTAPPAAAPSAAAPSSSAAAAAASLSSASRALTLRLRSRAAAPPARGGRAPPRSAGADGARRLSVARLGGGAPSTKCAPPRAAHGPQYHSPAGTASSPRQYVCALALQRPFLPSQSSSRSPSRAEPQTLHGSSRCSFQRKTRPPASPYSPLQTWPMRELLRPSVRAASFALGYSASTSRVAGSMRHTALDDVERHAVSRLYRKRWPFTLSAAPVSIDEMPHAVRPSLRAASESEQYSSSGAPSPARTRRMLRDRPERQ